MNPQEDLNERIRQRAEEEYKLMNAPLKFRARVGRYQFTYRGYTYTNNEPFTVMFIKEQCEIIDRRYSLHINSFTNPIFRKVFGLS